MACSNGDSNTLQHNCLSSFNCQSTAEVESGTNTMCRKTRMTQLRRTLGTATRKIQRWNQYRVRTRMTTNSSKSKRPRFAYSVLATNCQYYLNQINSVLVSASAQLRYLFNYRQFSLSSSTTLVFRSSVSRHFSEYFVHRINDWC